MGEEGDLGGLGFSIIFLKSLFGITTTMGWPVALLLVGFMMLAYPTMKIVKKMIY